MHRVLVVADTDLDGTSSAVLITKYYDMFYRSRILKKKTARVDVLFPSRPELDELFGNDVWCREMAAKYNEVYICDTAPNSEEACRNICEILGQKLSYFDHHATNLKRLLPFQHKVTVLPPRGLFIIEGDRCSAKITFDVLRGSVYETYAREFDKFARFAELVNDIDLWYRKFPRSTELADFVAEVGPERAFPELLTIADDPDTDTSFISEVLQRVQENKDRSLALGRATLVKHKGYKSPFYTCIIDDYASEVGSTLVHPNGLIAMWDIARNSFGFRIGAKFSGNAWHQAKGKKPNCLDFAEALGGGGHPQAAGANLVDNTKILKAVSQGMGEALLEDYHERSRSTADRRLRRKNTRRSKSHSVRPRVRSRSSKT